MSDFEILRRIAERGISAAQEKEDSQQVDCWQHMLDEIERARKLYHPSEDMETVEIDLEDAALLTFALNAHKEDVTLNHYLNRALMEMIERMGIEYLDTEDSEDKENGTSDN